MSETREEFEKLPIAAKYLQYVFFNKETQSYCNKSDNAVSLDFASFLNGAWYTYQEQQKIIDAYKLILKTQIGFDIANSILDQSKASENQNISPDCQNGIISKGEFLVSSKNSDSIQSKEVSINISKDGKITKIGD